MAEFISAVIVIVIFIIIPYCNSKSKEKVDARRKPDEFMKFHFGEDYKDKLGK